MYDQGSLDSGKNFVVNSGRDRGNPESAMEGVLVNSRRNRESESARGILWDE